LDVLLLIWEAAKKVLLLKKGCCRSIGHPVLQNDGNELLPKT